MDEKKKEKDETIDIEIEDGTQETSEGAEDRAESADNNAESSEPNENSETTETGETAENSEIAENSEAAENGETAENGADEALAKAEAKADEMSEKYLRLLAEFQNYKKRTVKEKEDACAYGTEKLMVELLKVLDNFERALETTCADENYAKGMELIFRQLQDTLQKAGLEEIEALGKEFDPNFHNAVTTEENPDYESGQVSGVLQKGYTLNKKVIRPSMVKVNK